MHPTDYSESAGTYERPPLTHGIDLCQGMSSAAPSSKLAASIGRNGGVNRLDRMTQALLYMRVAGMEIARLFAFRMDAKKTSYFTNEIGLCARMVVIILGSLYNTIGNLDHPSNAINGICTLGSSCFCNLYSDSETLDVNSLLLAFVNSVKQFTSQSEGHNCM